MRNNVKVSFWLFRSKANNTKESPIYMSIYFRGKGIKISTGHYVKPDLWDKKKKLLKSKTDGATAINDSLNALRTQVILAVNKLVVEGVPFSVFTIRDRLNAKEHKTVTVLQACDMYLESMKELKQEYSKPTVIKYTNTKLRVGEFIRSKYGRHDMYLYELDYDFIADFENFLKTHYQNGQTTCYKHYQRFTRIIRVALQKGHLHKYPFTGYSIKLPKKPVEYLTMEEIQRIQNASFNVERLEIVKDLFVFSCYCGLAYMEVANLTATNLYAGNDGETWIRMVRQKTGKEFRIPLLPEAVKIINKYKNHRVAKARNRLLPVPSNQKLNAYLAEIQDIVGITKKLHFHLARKSFSVSVILGNSLPIETLSHLLGHSSIKVTIDAYSGISDSKISNDFKELRKKLDREKKNQRKGG